MATMIPSVISPEVKSSAERRIFEWFKSARGTDDWIVLHSLGIATHNKVIYGEIDFLVLAPRLGLFAIEVKGGRVVRENGIWYFTNRYGKTNAKTRGPFDQAKDGAFSIAEAIKVKADDAHRHVANMLFGYGVMFPDLEFDASGVDEEQWQIFDSRDAEDVKGFIERLSAGTIKRWEFVYGRMDRAKLPNYRDVRYLSSILRGDFDRAVAMHLQFQKAKDQLIALTKEQYRCLDQLDDNPRCLIQGPAGTGKTLLAIEEVKRSTAKGLRVALFCYNSNLGEWLNYYFSDLPQDLRPVFVGTLHKYMMRVTRAAGTTPPFPSAKEKQQHYFQHELPVAAILAINESSGHFDKIVVDEAQDLIEDGLLHVLDACLLKGLDRGRWTMFGDFNRQAIYSPLRSGSSLIDKLENIAFFVRFRLTINCRNTKPICTEIQTITGYTPIENLWTKVDGPPVQYITWTDMDEQRDRLTTLLRQMEENHIPPNDITILSPRRREHSVVSMVEGFKIDNFTVPIKSHISFSTIHGYKGLENTVIILVDIEDYSSEQLMYVALSRACSGLYVLETEKAKEEYNALLMRRLLNA